MRKNTVESECVNVIAQDAVNTVARNLTIKLFKVVGSTDQEIKKMLGSPESEYARKYNVLVGESAFFHPDYHVDYSFAHEIRLKERLISAVNFYYAFEPSFRLTDKTDERMARYDKLCRFGFPIEWIGTIQATDAVLSYDYIIAPYLYTSSRTKKFSAKQSGPRNGMWLTLDDINVSREYFRDTFRHLEDKVLA